jgi:hypothetical protein
MIDFRQHLDRQIAFLRSSAAAYDAGFRDEAYRIAVAIRVLVHNTKTSTSLLRHLGVENAPLLSTTEPAPPNAVLYDGLSLVAFQTASGAVRAGLDESPTRRFTAAQDWWTETIYVLNNVRLSRKDIVLSAANQDGGAHVDASLNAEYASFKQGLWSFASDGNVVVFDLPEPQLVFLRQMAYEVVNSPSLRDIVATGAVTPANSFITPPPPPWTPPEVSQHDLDAMPISEVNRLRNVVRKGHFTLLDGFYRYPGGGTNPEGNFDIDRAEGYTGLQVQWIRALLDEGLVATYPENPSLVTSTPRGRAFVARITQIGH